MFEQNVFQGPGTGTFTSHTFEILFMLLVAFLIGVWLGWVLWSRYRQEAERLRIENVSLDATATTLRNEQQILNTKLAEAETGQATLESQVQSLNWDAEKMRNQLTVLESDMEKLQERNRQLEAELGLAVNQEGGTEGGLSPEILVPIPSKPLEEDLPDLETVATEGTPADPGSPDLAITEPPALTLDDAEPELSALDDKDDAGTTVVPTPVFIAPVPEKIEESETEKPKGKDKAEEPLVATVSKGPKDDLKIVEGIGPKIEELLFNAGVTTYGQLAATGVQQLKDILSDAGSRFAMHDPGTWPAQSLLAANGEWAELKAYQDFLNAGKRPDK